MKNDILDKKTIGDIVSIQHLEPVGYWHQAHSFVRGNWRNSQEASFMLLQKCCHDLDWLRMIMKDNCKQIQSFGSLKYFNKENQPKNAANRCMDCPKDVESNCPYSALKIYIKDRVDKDMLHWPVNVLVKDVTKEKVLDAIAKGPYGRCVFACDNDVVDNQVVNMEFANGSTVSMTMTAFAGKSGRQTKIFGTRGIAIGDDKSWQVYDYLSDKETSFDADLNADGSILSGHGGGDYHLIANFLDALLENDQSKILSGADESLESHLMVFAAEKSRLENKIINMNEFKR